MHRLVNSGVAAGRSSLCPSSPVSCLSSRQRMLYFELGRTGWPRRISCSRSSWVWVRSKGAFALFSTTMLGPVRFVLQNHSFFATRAGVAKTTPAAMRPQSFRQHLLDPAAAWWTVGGDILGFRFPSLRPDSPAPASSTELSFSGGMPWARSAAAIFCRTHSKSLLRDERRISEFGQIRVTKTLSRSRLADTHPWSPVLDSLSLAVF